MATKSISNAVPEAGNPQPSSGSTTLRGRIEAIGIQELLRISVTKGSTGRLLVFNDRADAELYYEQGKLVGAVSGGNQGLEVLELTLTLQDGEFEFAWGLVALPEQKTPNLHEAMLSAVKQYYETQVRNRQAAAASGNIDQRVSGVHRVESDVEQKAQPAKAAPPAPAARAPKPSEPDKEEQSASELASDELGNAVVDVSGRVLQKNGAFSQQDAAVASLALKLATRLGSLLGVRDLTGFELAAPDDKTLVCIASGEGMRAAKVSPRGDLDSVWRRLKS